MGKTGFIDITAEPKLYIFEKRAGKYGLLDTKNFSCSKDYDFSFSVLPDDIGEFYLSLPLHALNQHQFINAVKPCIFSSLLGTCHSFLCIAVYPVSNIISYG